MAVKRTGLTSNGETVLPAQEEENVGDGDRGDENSRRDTLALLLLCTLNVQRTGWCALFPWSEITPSWVALLVTAVYLVKCGLLFRG